MASAFNPALHAFRGFAIINITIIHALAWPFYIIRGREIEVAEGFGLFDALNGVLFHDSTLYFTFISGLLFSMILKERGYSRFYRSKFSYVFLPYLFFTLLSTALQWNWAEGDGAGKVLGFLGGISLNIVTGSAMATYWYIPVLIVLYCLTPLLDKLPSWPLGKWFCGILIAAPLLCSRVWPDVSWTNYAYFVGPYLIGMLVGKHYEVVMAAIARYWWTFLAVAVLSTAWFFYPGKTGPITFGFTNLDESVWYIQKIAIAAMVLLWFERHIKTVPGWLDVMANYAFALYFVHMFVLMFYFGMLDALGLYLGDSLTLTINLLVSYPIVISLCVGLIWLLRKMLGKYSRHIIGA